MDLFVCPETVSKGKRKLKDHVFDVQEISSGSSVLMRAKVV